MEAFIQRAKMISAIIAAKNSALLRSNQHSRPCLRGSCCIISSRDLNGWLDHQRVDDPIFWRDALPWRSTIDGLPKTFGSPREQSFWIPRILPNDERAARRIRNAFDFSPARAVILAAVYSRTSAGENSVRI